MMKMTGRLRGLLAGLLLLCPVPAFAGETPPAVPAGSASLASDLDAAIDGALTQKRLVGVVVLVAHDGRIIYHRAAGFADREAGTPMREDTIFRLASVSKAYTAMAAATLLEQGTLHLDDPVTKWLPEFTPRLPDGGPAEITIRQLLSHTAGLDYGFAQRLDGPYHLTGISDGLDISGLSLEENMRRLAGVPLLYKPGTSWRYSLAMDVLGAVIEKAHGAPLPQAMRELVTKPLGMVDTGFTVTDRSRLAFPYYNTAPQPLRMQDDVQDVDFGGGMSLRFSPNRAFDPKAFPSGGAGMVGTAPELLRLLETIRTGGAPLVGPAIMNEMNRSQTGKLPGMPGMGFGLGWAVLVDPAAAQTPQASGTLNWGGVYGNAWFIDPANKLSVVILTNTAPEGMWGQTITDVRDAVYRNLPQ